ncbi:MAG: macro domain-containing protein, partial [bacterium]|nr:macro domain-containing protein [bacterium]
TGHAVMTNGYNLKAKHIIHAVGPRDQNPYDLKHAFYNALVIADSNNLKSIGMVPISAGIFGFPIDQCASIALKVITSFKPKSLSEVRIYCYSQNEYQVFLQEYEKYLKANS